MKITIRSEGYRDFGRIAEIHREAFYSHGYGSEAGLAAILRQSLDFDPELSLIAEVDGTPVGHVLFFPFRMRLMGETLLAVGVGPLSVLLAYQKMGIGGMLLEHGHRLAKEKGYKLSFLYGDPEYFTRFGYRTGMFGWSYGEVDVSCIKTPQGKVIERGVLKEDLGELMDMWEQWYGKIDLSLCPGDSLVEWMSHSPLVKASSILINGQLKGFIRYCLGDREEIRMFLAKDKKSAIEILKHYKCNITRGGRVVLPIHPDSEGMSLLQGYIYHGELETWGSGMLCVLDEECDGVATYCQEVSAGRRNPGRILYPSYYDMV